MKVSEITAHNVHEKMYKTEKGAIALRDTMLSEYPKINFSVNPVDENLFNVIVSQVPRDIKRSSDIQNPCQYVWSTASEMIQQGFKRGEIIKQCISDGVAYHTARTQYQLWFTAYKASKK